jgi:hypothetical protein
MLSLIFYLYASGIKGELFGVDCTSCLGWVNTEYFQNSRRGEVKNLSDLIHEFWKLGGGDPFFPKYTPPAPTPW